MPTPTHHISGIVLSQDSTPISRRVAVFSRDTLELLGQTDSDEETGEYEIGIVGDAPCFVVCFPAEDESINARIYDRVIPAEN